MDQSKKSYFGDDLFNMHSGTNIKNKEKQVENAERITILHIVEAPGGVERYLHTLLSKLDNTIFENILVWSDSYDSSIFKEYANTIEYVSDMHNKISISCDLKSIKAVRKLIKKYKPDIVYCHSSKAGAIGRIANIGLKNKTGKMNVCIYNAHGWAFNMKDISNKKIKAYVLIEKMLALFCDKIVCISDFEKRSALLNHICKTDKFRVIYNGIDFNEGQDITFVSREQLQIPESAFVIGTTGRIAHQKAPDVFVRTAAEIKKEIPSAFFIMVGDGLELEQTKNLIKELKMDDSFFITGWVNNPLDYIRNFDIAMLLSRWEGFGLVLPEYMITGKPIVATRVDAIPDVVKDGINGLLVDVNDYKAASASVIRLYEDKELRCQLIANGRKIVYKYFNADRVGQEHEVLFKEMIGNRT